ncbi:MAG TPA: glycosyltransferase family 39 protein [Vicinamibacterales bacterium]|nr:glycosyltransferase family 39 protein [Vicinamibacterales bacterium]
MPAFFSAREYWLSAAAFVLVASLTVMTGFTSSDPDSALYAGLAARLTDEPVARWVAPEWWGFWPEAHMTGLFREHPAGIFWAPAALARLGLPAEQSAYVVGALASLVAIVLLGLIVSRLTTRADARAVVLLVQLMPVAFIFRMRANHEYPMLVCLLIVIIGIDGLRQARWPWLLVAIGLTGGLLIKGVFVSIIVLAAGLWLVADPLRAGQGAARQWTGVALAVLAAIGVAALYDVQTMAVTGEPFWSAYWARQMAPLAIATPWEDAVAIASRIWFYVTRLVWHPAPWSLALVWLAVTRGGAWRGLAAHERRALVVAISFVVLAVGMLSLPSRFAERYAFSAVFVVGTVGAIAARRAWPALAGRLAAADERVPALPAVVWTVLAIGRLMLGPYLPRLQA